VTVNRRTVVTGTTSLALAAVGQAQAGPMNLPPSEPLIQMAALNPLTQGALDKSALIIKKRALANKYAWLKPFAVDLPIDAFIYNTTSNLVDKQPPYDPYQIESLAAAVSTLLDRCLTYQQSMYSLDEKATQRALEYDLFQNQTNAQKAIELAAYLEQKWTNEKNGHTGVETVFSNDTGATSSLSKGFAALAKLNGSSAATLATGEQTRKQNVNTKYNVALDYQNALQARHETPGHALNYGERYQRVSKMLQEDIGVAFQKLQCLSKACNYLFGLTFPLSPPVEVGYLDYMVTYTRELLNLVEIATINEVNFNHVVYLRQPKSLASTNPANPGRISAGVWSETLNGTRLFTFNLKDNEFPSAPAITRLRMQSLGMSMTMGNPASTDTTIPLKSASAVIFPPEVPDLFSDSGKGRRLLLKVLARPSRVDLTW
jgi:hypothetical protein